MTNRYPNYCHGTPESLPDLHSPLGFSPRRILALSPVPNQEACHNESSDLPSLPDRAIDLTLSRNRLIVPGSQLSVWLAVP